MKQDLTGLLDCFELDQEQALKRMSQFQSRPHQWGIGHQDLLILYMLAVLELIQEGPREDIFLISLTELRRRIPHQYSDSGKRKLWLTWLCDHFPIFDVVTKSSSGLTHITLRIKS
jgi:hypothetical protein